MAQIDVASFEQISIMLSQLATNYSNLFVDYYNLFCNPTPMDITVELYDIDGNLSTITIPNRAKDRTYILNGNGNPEGVVSAPKGSTYQDLTNGVVYVKQFTTSDNTGWSELMTVNTLGNYFIQGEGSPEGEVTAVKGVLYVDKAASTLYIKTTEIGNTGWDLISVDTSNLANRDLSNLTTTGEAHFANPSFTNLSASGQAILDAKEASGNKKSSWGTSNANVNDTYYPTTKLVYDSLSTATSPLANKDLSNLNVTGEDHFVRISNQVRDCIFKAPNGLPSVSGNIISLPQGTVLLCANGVDSNRAVVNEKITTASALSASVSWTGAGNGILFFDGTYNTLNYKSEGEYFRQVSQPVIATTYGMWYNPNTNEYKVTSNTGSTWTTIKAAEIGRFTTNSSGVIDSFYPYHPLRVALEDDLNNIKISQRNIGEIVTSTMPLVDAGLHLLDGSLLSKSGIYGAFVEYIEGLYTADPTANYFCSEADWQQSVTDYGVCGKFVYDGVNNTVRLPKVIGFIEGTIDSNTLGDLVEAGLPNIMGEFFGESDIQEYTYTGAFYRTTIGSKKGIGSTDADNYQTGFDASRSNSIYGNSTTVQPQAVKVLYYIVVATSAKTQIQVDIDNIATDLNGKADVDLSNINPTQTVIDTIVGWGIPDYSRAVSFTPTSGDTLDYNGWLQASTSGSYGPYYVEVNGIKVLYNYGGGNDSGGANAANIVMVKSGDVITFSGSNFQFNKIPFVGGSI